MAVAHGSIKVWVTFQLGGTEISSWPLFTTMCRHQVAQREGGGGGERRRHNKFTSIDWARHSILTRSRRVRGLTDSAPRYTMSSRSHLILLFLLRLLLLPFESIPHAGWLYLPLQLLSFFLAFPSSPQSNRRLPHVRRVAESQHKWAIVCFRCPLTFDCFFGLPSRLFQ